METLRSHLHPPTVGHVSITNGALAAFKAAQYSWDEFWPRHTKAMLDGKSIMSMIQLPSWVVLAVGTNQQHTETMIALPEEVL